MYWIKHYVSEQTAMPLWKRVSLKVMPVSWLDFIFFCCCVHIYLLNMAPVGGRNCLFFTDVLLLDVM